MGPIAEQLSNEDVRDLGAYFASLKASDSMTAKGPDDHPDLTEAGKKAAVAGRCASSVTETIMRAQPSPVSLGNARITL